MPWALCPDPGAAADKFCPNATTESQGEPRGSRARYIQSAAGTVNCLYSRKRPIVTTPAMTRQPLGADSRLAALSPSVLPPRAQGTALRAHPCTQHLHHRQHCAVPSLQPTPGPTLSTARPYIHVASKSNHNSIKSNQDDFFFALPKRLLVPEALGQLQAPLPVLLCPQQPPCTAKTQRTACSRLPTSALPRAAPQPSHSEHSDPQRCGGSAATQRRAKIKCSVAIAFLQQCWS